MRSGPNSVHFRLRIVGLKIRAVMKPGLRFWVDEPYFWIGEPFFFGLTTIKTAEILG